MLFSEQFKTIFRSVSEHVELVALFASVIPFVIAVFMLTIFSRGNVETVNYLIQEIGIFQVWTMGLSVIIFSIITTALVGVIAYVLTNLTRLNTQGWEVIIVGSVLIGVAIVVTPVGIILILVFVALITAVLKLLLRSKLSKIKPTTRSAISSSIDKYGFLILFVLILYGGIASYPTLPVSKLTLKDNSKQQGIILNTDDTDYLLFIKENRDLATINRTDVTKIDRCIKTGGKFFLPFFVDNDQLLLDNC